MLVYGRNVAKEFLKNNKKVRKIIIQDSFDDKEILSLIEKSNLRKTLYYQQSSSFSQNFCFLIMLSFC